MQHVIATVSKETLGGSGKVVNVGAGPGVKGPGSCRRRGDAAHVVVAWRPGHMPTVMPRVLMFSDQVDYTDGKAGLLAGLWLHDRLGD